MERAQGVLFPADDQGRRSTASTGKAVWAEAMRSVDDALAERIEDMGDWRKAYVEAVVAHTAAAAASPEAARRVARQGLSCLADRMRFERDGAVGSVAEALRDGKDELRAATVQGEAARDTALQLPYRGELLTGDALRRQADDWAARGTVEPSCAHALHAVLDNPDWLDVSDRAFALLGAGAEMGPLEPLLRWGGHVVAVDVAQPRIWDRLRATARAGAGTLTLPETAEGPGVDLLTQTPEVAVFLRGSAEGRPLTVGSYAYADGAKHVQVVHASDAIVELLLRDRPGTSYAELATPTDAYAVPAELIADAHARWAGRGWRKLAQAPIRGLTRGGLFAPSYPDPTSAIVDVLVPQQGANYTLAKRVQRWRAIAAQADGHLVSANVAPATKTRSVTKNKLLAAAYAGAHRFGVEVFAPETSRVLMAALLVHDLRAQTPTPAQPDELFAQQAAHSGLWRVGYLPRSVLGLAAVTGLPSALR